MRLRDIVVVMMCMVALTACTERETQKMEWQVKMGDKWIPAQVPSTIMGVLTANGIEPEALTAEDYANSSQTASCRSWHSPLQ